MIATARGRHRQLVSSISALSAVALLTALPAEGQEAASPPSSMEHAPEPLRARVGLGLARSHLASDGPETRQRGFVRLGAHGSSAALEQLAAAVESDGMARSPLERLTVVRALAPHAGRPVARRALARVLVSPGSTDVGAPREPLAELARETAAMALAASGEPRALAALAGALQREGPAGLLALGALAAHPPVDLKALIGGGVAPNPLLIRLLADLDDHRGAPLLRSFAELGSPATRALAAVSLARMDEPSAIAIAERWSSGTEETELRLAAAEILVLTHHPKAAATLRGLLADSRLAAGALELLKRRALPELVPELRALLARAEYTEAVIAALSEIGNDDAAAALSTRFAQGKFGNLVALALARNGSGTAATTLGTALSDPRTRRTAVRGAAVRFFLLGQKVHGTENAIGLLARSDDASDRAVAAFAQCTFSTERCAALARSSDVDVVVTAARFALVPQVAHALLERLEQESDAALRFALSGALTNASVADLLSVDLSQTLDGRCPGCAALAAKAVAFFADKPRLDELLEQEDSLVRGQAALGLGGRELAGALALLERAYLREPEASVRWAILDAAARRPERSSRRLLELAAGLDPATPVRERAKLGLSGQPFVAKERGYFWRELRGPNASRAAILAIAEDARVLPLVADPDGVLVALHLPDGPLRYRTVDLGLTSPSAP